MGILKVGHKISGASSYGSQTFCFLDGKGIGVEDNPASGPDSGDDSDDYDFTEVNCELGMVEGQLCSIPYELYDLPDLREILSLDTWNSCLTEEERFSLSAYLPDMDQQTFMLTMKELFGGSDIYFGNALDIFFKRLKGGFYPPKVACFRECLEFYQRRKYYHSLRSYHDNMVQVFKDMKTVWDQCDKRSAVNERLYVWSKKRKQKDFDLLDLNTVPTDGCLLKEEVKSDAYKHHLLNRVNSVESKKITNTLPALTLSCGAKGVLKVKASKTTASQNHPKMVFCDVLEQYRSVPKGLLKVVPKVPAVRPEQSNAVLRRLQPTSLVGTQGLQDRNLSCLPASTHSGNVAGYIELPSLWQNLGDRKVHTTQELPNCVLNQQEITLTSSGDTRSSTRKVKREMDQLLDDITDTGNHKLFVDNSRRSFNGEFDSSGDTMGAKRCTYGGENLWKNLGLVDKELSVRSLDLYPFGIQYYQGEQHSQTLQKEHIPGHPRFPEVVPRIADIGTVTQERAMASSSIQMNGKNDVSIRKLDNILSKRSESEGIKFDHMLPLTYKRRKVQVKRNSLDFSKSLIAATHLESGSLKEPNQHLSEGAKAVKRWKETPLDKEPSIRRT